MVNYITKIEDVEQINQNKQKELKKVADRFLFCTNDYYLSLINWDDPDGPIRRIVIPHTCELEKWGKLDASDEHAYTVMPGLEHKYNSTAVFLVSNRCGGICRYCFRKRVFRESSEDLIQNLDEALKYVQQHKEITNVLLTGGDPLMLTTKELENIISKLRQIEHVKIIRIGTRMPVFNPYRIIDDADLLEMINKYSTAEKRMYVITHFDHPRELTKTAIKGLDLIQKAGAIMTNQMPLIRGVNDDPDVLAELLAKLSFVGVTPYYIFQCRPTLGNHSYSVPIEEGYEIIETAKSKVSGLAKRVKFVMSHSSGKIEIVGKTKDHVYFKYHRAAIDKESGCFMAFPCNPDARWLEDYGKGTRDYLTNLPLKSRTPR